MNVSVKDVDATSLLILLEEEGICASAGSACSSGQTRISHVIEAIHVPSEWAAGSVRFTMGRQTGKTEVDAVIDGMKKCVQILRG